LIVEQQGIDLTVTILSPDNNQINRINSNREQGSLEISIVAQAPGVYYFEVSAADKKAPPGRYKARIGELREATDKDKIRVAAQKAFAEGDKIREPGTADSIRKAAGKYEEALSHWKAIGDRGGEAAALARLGDLYVNDAFSCAHRAHASTEGIAHLLPSAAGRLMQEELEHLEKAFSNFKDGRTGYPQFKRKYGKQSFQCPGNKPDVDFEKRLLFIPKFREGIKVNISRIFTGKIKTLTITQTASGEYYVSVLTQDDRWSKVRPITEAGAIGIDLNVGMLMVCSDGQMVHNSRPLNRNLARLRILSCRLGRKKKGTQNWKKARIRLARWHERIANQRIDHIQKETSKIVYDSQVDTICMEDLDIKGMMQNKYLARDLEDASFDIIRRTIEYKCVFAGKNFVQVDPYYASTKTCNSCGHQNAVKAKQKLIICEKCKCQQGRDLGAAVNIKREGLRKLNYITKQG